jgi:glucosamine--fructose-6-phosphate aminotransferase (isomerizing)
MCGITGCRRPSGALEFLLTSLHRLEYRGYDSAGVALASPGRQELDVVRSAGKVADLERRCQESTGSGSLPLSATAGIGHTRWATHGAPTEQNAHPHIDCSGGIAVVHNGVIDNAPSLRTELIARGHGFRSEVDTEVIPHLLEEHVAAGATLAEALLLTHPVLRGSWAVAALDAATGSLAATAMRSPLLLGIGSEGLHVASDAAALAGSCEYVMALEDGDVVDLGETVRWWGADGKPGERRPHIPTQPRVAEVGFAGHVDYMSKEIAEQDAVASRVVSRLLPGLDGSLWRDLRLPEPQRVRFVACGSSLNAAAATARVFRQVAGLPTRLVVASEWAEELTESDTLTVAVSQSGETADVLSAVERLGGPVLAVTNVAHSTLGRRADAVLLCDAGTEMSVAATKTFTAQVLVGSALGLSLAAARTGVCATLWPHIRAFAETPDQFREVLATTRDSAEALAEMLADGEGFLFLSRAGGLPYAREGALKLKEITYRWAEAHAAGELKHGPIALIGPGTPVVVIDGGDPAKMAGSIAEVRARGARVIQVGQSAEALFQLPGEQQPSWGPLAAVVPLQYLAHALALALGKDADRPRNLAKSVTVE